MTWRCVRVETVALETRDTIDPKSLECPLVEHYSIPSLEATGLPELVPPDEILSAKQVLRGGEVMVSRLNPRKARVLRVPEKLDQPTVASGEFIVMQPSGVDGDFLTLVLLSEDVRQYLHSCVQSVTRSHQRIRPDHLLKMPIHIPEFETQIAIRDYVGSETARIDKLITLQESLIERLDEYRTALVTRVVTKGLPPEAAEAAGLDPKPTLKDSGVEWLGEVPEHWDVVVLKRIASINDEALSDDEEPTRLLEYVDIGSVRYGEGVVERTPMVFEDAPSRARRLVQDGDTIISTVRTYLRAIAHLFGPPPSMVVSTGFAVIRPRSIEPRFTYWAMSEAGLVSEIVARSVGVSYPAINAHEIGLLAIAVPPREEQQAIAGYLDEQSSRIDRHTAGEG